MRLKLTREQKVADRYLRSFDMVQDRLKSSVTGLERAVSARDNVTASYDAFGGSCGDGDKLLRAIVRIEEAVTQMERWSGLLQDEFARVESLITDVQRMDPDAGKVLRLVYIEHEGQAEITEGAGIPKKQVYECQRRGLDLAFDLLAGDADDSDR